MGTKLHLQLEDIYSDPYGFTYSEVAETIGEEQADKLYHNLYSGPNGKKQSTIRIKEVFRGPDTQKYAFELSDGYCIPSNIELSGLEVRLINAISRERVLKTCMNEVKKNYDYVLIDCMPSLGMLTINALAAADSVIIPTQPHYLSAKGLKLLLRSVSKVRRQINPHLRIDGILMSMVMPSALWTRRCSVRKRKSGGSSR